MNNTITTKSSQVDDAIHRMLLSRDTGCRQFALRVQTNRSLGGSTIYRRSSSTGLPHLWHLRDGGGQCCRDAYFDVDCRRPLTANGAVFGVATV